MEKPGKYPIISLKSSLNRGMEGLNLWQAAWKATALSNWWQLSLIAIGSASSVIYPHPPLVGFAAVAGNTLIRKKSLISAAIIWFANQLYGFTIRRYPFTLESLTWGLVMGVGMLTVTWLVTLVSCQCCGWICHLSRQYLNNCPINGRTWIHCGNFRAHFC
jgi:hypothetical protein